MPTLSHLERYLAQFRWLRWLAFAQMSWLALFGQYSAPTRQKLTLLLLVVGVNILWSHLLFHKVGHHHALLTGPIEALAVLYAVYLTGGVHSEIYLALFIGLPVAGRGLAPHGALKLLAVLGPLYTLAAVLGTATPDSADTFVLAVRLSVLLVTGLYLDALVAKGNASRREAQDLLHEVRQAHEQLQTNARQLEQTNQQLDRKLQDLVLLQETSLILSSSLELNRIVQLLVDSARRITEFENCYVSICDHERQYRTVVFAEGVVNTQLGERVPFDRGLVGWVAVNRQGVLVPDRRLDARVHSSYNDSPINSLMVVPLVANDRTVGVLTLGSVHYAHFTDDHLRLFQILGVQAGLAIENAGLYEQTRQSAITDGLTGLYNYRYFRSRFSEEMRRADRNHSHASLLMIDVDSFKRINDTHGHPQGDSVLRELAQILKSSLRAVDIVCRTGGEEFSIILPDTGHGGAEHVARTLVEKVANHTFQGDLAAGERVTISVGLATYPDESEEDLIRLADSRMYLAKTAGGNRYSTEPIKFR